MADVTDPETERIYAELSADARRLLDAQQLPEGTGRGLDALRMPSKASDKPLPNAALVRLLCEFIDENRASVLEDLRQRSRRQPLTDQMQIGCSTCTASVITFYLAFKPLQLELLVPWQLAHGECTERTGLRSDTDGDNTTPVAARTADERAHFQRMRKRFLTLVGDTFTVDGERKHGESDMAVATHDLLHDLGTLNLGATFGVNMPAYENMAEASEDDLVELFTTLAATIGVKRCADICGTTFTTDNVRKLRSTQRASLKQKIATAVGEVRMRRLCTEFVPGFFLLVEADVMMRNTIEAMCTSCNRACDTCGQRAPSKKCVCDHAFYCGPMCQQNHWSRHKVRHTELVEKKKSTPK